MANALKKPLVLTPDEESHVEHCLVLLAEAKKACGEAEKLLAKARGFSKEGSAIFQAIDLTHDAGKAVAKRLTMIRLLSSTGMGDRC